MGDKMTLEQVRDWLRGKTFTSLEEAAANPCPTQAQMADAIDAHLNAAKGEVKPFGWVEADVVPSLLPDEEGFCADGIECMILRERNEHHTTPIYAYSVSSNAAQDAPDDPVAWTVIDSNGESSIGGWLDMRHYEAAVSFATLRKDHHYAFAYARPSSPDDVRDAKRYRKLRSLIDEADPISNEAATIRNITDDSINRGSECLNLYLDDMDAREGGE